MAITASGAIATFNTGREPERLALKYTAMRANAFSFLRGSCHLFHQRMIEHALAPEGPSAWICGDLHLENFGTFLGGNGLIYFDVNDFDETVRAPVTWDILRLATSILVAAPVIGVKTEPAKRLATHLVEAYFAELARGKPLWIERRTARGPVGELIETLKRRDDARLLAKRTVVKGGRRTLVTDNGKALPVTKADREALTAFLAKVANPVGQPRAFGLIDAARRIAGTGSLGIARFVLLVEGDGGDDGHWLLDLKAAAPSALVPFLAQPQPAWASEAARVVAIETLFQANTPSLLSAHVWRGGPYVLKRLQPSADRLDLQAIAASPAGLETAMEDMAHLAAWGHLRASGRYGAATGDELIAAAADKKASRGILDRAGALAEITAADYAEFAAAFDRGVFAAK